MLKNFFYRKQTELHNDYGADDIKQIDSSLFQCYSCKYVLYK